MRVTFVPETDAAGGVCGGVHVVTDVSELKESKLRLRESEECYRTLVETSPDFIFLVDRASA